MKDWSNLAKVVYRRTYARNDTGITETWNQTIDRVIEGNLRTVQGRFSSEELEKEEKQLRYLALNRKAGPAGRGYWFSGAPSHKRIGGAALNNCWLITAENWENYVIGMDLLMLGGGVGITVEHKYVSKLPKIKKDVTISHRGSKDADFIVPDSREGWCELGRRILESYFETGKSFTFSTVCIRGYGEKIVGFGGKASGPIPLIEFADKLCKLLGDRSGRHVRPIDAMDILCLIGELVVSGNVRRSAIIILGDGFDKDYLKSKRWDLGPIPNYRGCANLSVVCDDIEDLHPLFWKTYEQGEPFGLVNRKNIQQFARMGEKKKDAAVGVNPCAEACLEPFEPCNLQEIALPNLDSIEEFEEAAVLMHRYGKRVTLENYHIPEVQAVIKKNRRVGTGITGCLQAPQFFNPDALDRVYQAVQKENRSYSKTLGIEESVRTTVIKPSGTMSKVMDCAGEGIHAAYSRHMIQRVRFSSSDPLVAILKTAGHHIEPQINFDGTLNHGTVVVDFYIEAPAGTPVADEQWDTWKQLDVLKMAQKHWADQAVSVTVYYRKEEIAQLKEWLGNNLKYLKTISFLCHNDHGFKQAPKEAITKEEYDKLAPKITSIDMEAIHQGELDSLECASGSCPIK